VAHTPSLPELRQHLANATDLLADACVKDLSALGRFNAAYGASHALLTAAIKMRGHRPGHAKGHRQLLFELLDQLLPAAAAAKPVLSQAHALRNKAEYDGDPVNVTPALVSAVLAAVANVDQEVRLAFKTYSANPPGGTR